MSKVIGRGQQVLSDPMKTMKLDRESISIKQVISQPMKAVRLIVTLETITVTDRQNEWGWVMQN